MEQLRMLKIVVCLVMASAMIVLVVSRDRDESSHFAMWHRHLVELMNDDRQLEPLFPLTAWDYLGFSAAIVGLILAAGGGIGGGGILVPIYILVLQFPVKHAIPLSNVTVFGGAVANTILNARKRHPNADRPLIDWNLILVMEPLTMAGALVGADINELLPEVAIVIMLVMLLSLTAHKTLTKALRMHEKETHELLGVKDNEASCDVVLLPNQLSANRLPNSPESNRSASSYDDAESANKSTSQQYGACEMVGASEIEYLTLFSDSDSDNSGNFRSRKILFKILEQERFTPWNNVLSLAGLFFVVTTINVLKGGGSIASPIGIECGSVVFWVTEASILVIIFSFVLWARRYLVKQTHLKEAVKYQYLAGDIPWDSRATLVYPAVCSVAGVAAGMFGIGGGIVKGPLMLAMGVHPAVASATSACMILFTSSTATTMYAIFGLLNVDYAVVCATVGFFSTLVGQTVMHWLLEKYQRNSYIAFCIGVVVAISGALLTIESVIALLNGGEQDKRSGFCGSTI